jgi:hypothetical protein
MRRAPSSQKGGGYRRDAPFSRNGGGYRCNTRPPPKMEEGINATRALLQKWHRGAASSSSSLSSNASGGAAGGMPPSGHTAWRALPPRGGRVPAGSRRLQLRSYDDAHRGASSGALRRGDALDAQQGCCGRGGAFPRRPSLPGLGPVICEWDKEHDVVVPRPVRGAGTRQEGRILRPLLASVTRTPPQGSGPRRW